MKLTDVDRGVLQTVIETLPVTFQTKDLSRHKIVRDAHRSHTEDRNYHSMIGSYLSRHRVDLQLQLVSKGNGKGAIWRKGSSESSPFPQIISSRKHVEKTQACVDVGPQSANDGAFTARMRLHQSWYRKNILKAPCGVGPRATSKNFYGNMLTVADGERGLNFLTPRIYDVVRHRLAQGKGAVEPFRLKCNMLSSQPMCFNLFGLLVDDLDLAARLFRTILPEEIALVERVVIEFAPESASEYLADRTAFDAFVSYKRPDGSRGFIGIETKLTEPFSRKVYDGPAYRKWTEYPNSPWPAAAWARLADMQHNQLWRDHLLAIAMRDQKRSSYTTGFFMLVHHPGNLEEKSIVTNYRALLKPGDHTFIDMPLDHLMELWTPIVDSTTQRWLAEFKLRYLDLFASKEAV